MDKTYYANSRHEMLKYVPLNCKVILEIGCGEGNFSKLCKEKTGAYIIGIEYDQDAGMIASKKIDQVYIGDANQEIYKLKDNSIDLVVFNDVLEHIAYPDMLIESLKPKMKNGGFLLASIPNIRFIANLKHIIWDKDFKYDKNGGIRDYTHLRFFTEKSILSFINKLEFEVIIFEGINTFPLDSYKQKIKFWLLCMFGQKDTTYLQFAVLCKLL